MSLARVLYFCVQSYLGGSSQTLQSPSCPLMRSLQPQSRFPRFNVRCVGTRRGTTSGWKTTYPSHGEPAETHSTSGHSSTPQLKQDRPSGRRDHQGEGKCPCSSETRKLSTDTICPHQLAGLCGSDLHVYRGHEDIDKPCVTFEVANVTHALVCSLFAARCICGHEFIGTVVALGSSFGEHSNGRPPVYKTLRIGDSVLAPFTVTCGECRCAHPFSKSPSPGRSP